MNQNINFKTLEAKKQNLINMKSVNSLAEKSSADNTLLIGCGIGEC